MANLPFSSLFPEDALLFGTSQKSHLELNLTNDVTDRAELYKLGAQLGRLILSELQTDAVEKGPTANQWLLLGRSWDGRRWTKRGWFVCWNFCDKNVFMCYFCN